MSESEWVGGSGQACISCSFVVLLLLLLLVVVVCMGVERAGESEGNIRCLD